MSLILENGSGAPLDVNDLGISLTTGQTFDLTQNAGGQIVAISANGGDLDTLITSGDLIVKDPIGGADLTPSDGLSVVRAMNDSTWRVGSGARLVDLSDVDASGISDTYVIQFNSSSGNFEMVAVSDLGSGLSIGDLSDIDLTGISNGQGLAYDSGNFVAADFQPLDSDLTALAAIASTGLYAITGSGTSTTRSVAGTSSRISVTNGDGVAGNPTIDIASTYAGQATITTLGTVATGTWSATEIGTNKGGTGLTSIGSANQVLGVNTGASALEYKTITAGSGITVTPATGSITIAASGGGSSFIQRFTFQADQCENPINSGWAVNELAEASADVSHADLIVRNFDDTTESGIGARFTVPTGATDVTFRIKSKAQSAPGSTQGVQPTLYHSVMEDNASWGSWSSALNLTVISIPTNVNLQYDSQTISLATLGWSVGDFVRIELTRRGTQGGDTLSGNWNLAEIILEFI